ncbi:MAG: HIT domain-containing protein [Patescibacteria group bacterium]
MLYNNYLKKLKKCPFCEASNRELIANNNAYLTYAKAPYHKHHLLIIPKKHVVSFFDITKNEAKDIDVLIKTGTRILKKLKYNNFTILVREGDDSNKSIKHIHYHLIPSDPIGDLNNKGKPRVMLSNKEVINLSAKISSLANSLPPIITRD